MQLNLDLNQDLEHVFENKSGQYIENYSYFAFFFKICGFIPYSLTLFLSFSLFLCPLSLCLFVSLWPQFLLKFIFLASKKVFFSQWPCLYPYFFAASLSVITFLSFFLICNLLRSRKQFVLVCIENRFHSVKFSYLHIIIN